MQNAKCKMQNAECKMQNCGFYRSHCPLVGDDDHIVPYPNKKALVILSECEESKMLAV
jgi:hypothetical protein